MTLWLPDETLDFLTLQRCALRQVCASECDHSRVHFGRGQIIRRHKDGVLWGGSDPRADGQVIGW